MSSGRIEKVPIDWSLVASVLGGLALGWAMLSMMHGSSNGAAYVPDTPDVAIQTENQQPLPTAVPAPGEKRRSIR